MYWSGFSRGGERRARHQREKAAASEEEEEGVTRNDLYSEEEEKGKPDVLFDALDNGTVLALTLTENTSGYNFYSFSAYCTSWEVNTPVEDNTSVSATFNISGAVYRGTN